MTTSLDLDSDRFRLNPRYRMQWEEAQQCHVLLYPEGLIRLNASAAEILGRCREGVTQAELVAQLQQAFPDADSLPADVAEFLVHARAEEWIVRDGNGALR